MKMKNDYLQNFLLLFISSLVANFVKKSHIEARIYFIFLKKHTKTTVNSFNTKFEPQ